MAETKYNYEGILNGNERWERDIPHDPRSVPIGRALGYINFEMQDDTLCLKYGGDGDNGEELLTALDIYFELLDRGRI